METSFENYVRVTDVLFPFSGLTQVKADILKAAANRGTMVHQICDALIEDVGVPEIEDSIKGYIQSFSFWSHEKRFIKKPDRFFCETHKITGECDAIYEEEDGLVLVDFKTSSKESKTWRLQGSAYSYMAKKEKYPIKNICFVKLSKDGSLPSVYEYEEDFGTFLKCLDLYRLFFSNIKTEDFSSYL